MPSLQFVHWAIVICLMYYSDQRWNYEIMTKFSPKSWEIMISDFSEPKHLWKMHRSFFKIMKNPVNQVFLLLLYSFGHLFLLFFFFFFFFSEQSNIPLARAPMSFHLMFDMLSQSLVPSMTKKAISYSLVLGQQPLTAPQIQKFH